jgi:hypothetical protein
LPLEYEAPFLTNHRRYSAPGRAEMGLDHSVSVLASKKMVHDCVNPNTIQFFYKQPKIELFNPILLSIYMENIDNDSLLHIVSYLPPSWRTMARRVSLRWSNLIAAQGQVPSDLMVNSAMIEWAMDNDCPKTTPLHLIIKKNTDPIDLRILLTYGFVPTIEDYYHLSRTTLELFSIIAPAFQSYIVYSTAKVLIYSDNEEIVDYYVETAPRDICVLQYAIKRKNAALIEKMIHMGYTLLPRALTEALINKAFDIADLLHKHNCPVDDYIVFSVGFNPDTLNWLKNNGYSSYILGMGLDT